MNYFRTVTAIMNYQIQASKTRQKKEVYADSGLKEAFNSIIETYSIDDDLDIYGTNEEGGKSRIESETIPELQRMLQKAPTGRSDGMMISQVGQAMNRDIEEALKDAYGRDLDFILGKLADNSVKHTMREHGEGIQKAEEENNAEAEPKAKKAPKLFPEEVEKNPVERRKAFMDIFKTAMKIGIFGTEYKTLPTLIAGLKTDPNLREIIYDTLLKRGTIQEGSDPDFIMRLITRELEYIVEQKKNSSYSGMKEAFNSKETGNKFQEVLEYIKDHLTPKDKERHKFGEVFTPLTLVDEMLSKLPQEGKDNVWNKKDYKWLDPANGIGNFPIKAFIGQNEGEYKYPGLFEGLKKEIPDDKRRCEWIIENMLYMVDINGKNNLIAKRLFEKLCSSATANIVPLDTKEGFLTEKPLIFNGKEIKEFDIIMGNPPFNRGGINRPDTRKNKKVPAYEGEKKEKKETIWNKFVLQSVKLLKPSGFLVFIHPIGWFHSGDYDNVREILLKKQIHNIKIYKDDSQAVKEFSGSGKISVSYYIMENIPVYKNTIVEGTLRKKENVRLTENSIILLNNSSIINKLILKLSFWKENKNFKHTSVPCVKGEHKQISGIYQNGNINIVKTAQKHIDSGVPKIIISGRNYPRIYIDDGKYGLVGSGVNYWIGSSHELKLLESFLKTKLAAFLTRELKYRANFVEFKYFPDITNIPIEKITDETLADYFGFTEGERAVIEATEYPKREYKFEEVTCAQLKGETEKEGGARNVTRRKSRN
jgi:hypothetical protein